MRHLLSISDLSKSDAISILDTAAELARVSDGAVKKLPTLRGRTIVNLFAEDSTRTRISFEASDSGLSAADTVAEIIGETLGWKSADRKNSVQSFAKVISEEESALKALVNS